MTTVLTGPWRWVVLAAAVALAGCLVGLNHDDPGFSTPRLLLIASVGLVMVGAGLAAAANGEDRIGLLVVLAGVAWLLERTLVAVPNQWVYSSAGLLPGLWAGLLFHAVVTFPTGRLRGALDWLTVGGFYLLQVVGQWFILLTIPRWEPRGGAGPNELVLFPNAELADRFSRFADEVTVPLLALLVILLVHRWGTAAPPARRAYGFVWFGGIVLCANLTLLIIAGLGVVRFDLVYGLWLEYVAGAVPITMAISLFAARVAQDRLVHLVVDLDAGERGEQLVASLRRTLADPSLELFYRGPGDAGWIDRDGQPVGDLVRSSEDRVATPVEYRGSPIATIVHDPVLLRSPDRLATAAAAAGLAIDNERLQAELRARLADVQASRARIVEVGDIERRRVERNLHDGAQQRLLALGMTLNLAGRRATADPELTALLDEAVTGLDEAISELRDLAHGIHPAVVTVAGLSGAIETIAQRPGVPLTLQLDLPDRLSETVEVAAYYVVAEAVTNANKHARADRILVRASVVDGHLRVAVEDDGRGGATGAGGSGLEGLHDRVSALGGTFEVASPRGGGTVVTATFPLTPPV